ncbi:inorganic phosphate transporter [Methylobacterium sp. GC_Met_2]|uniref:inorganic phosphate transporter n=1 Tax=Methylobacterium sp. GC_Met_2 TaxID=2937376 RepID=UPI00226B51AA|nr:inorganic phosphate transporter [Methylobacterium sp. GC_Met_2]
MLASLTPGSPTTLSLILGCLVLALVFEFSNGFHDAANAVATVIYTHSLKPFPAVVWSGLMNFAGVILGGIAVAYALVELIPPDALTPPNGGAAVGMLAALFVSALSWNIGTWWLGIPNSSSHALIGSLIGIAVADTFLHGRGLAQGVDWHQVWDVLASLLVSPLLGFGLALLVFQLLKRAVHDRHLYEPPKEGQPPVWWMRALLIFTCTGVSFAHGTNDGQKSIGLIMLTIIGLYPAEYALNPQMTQPQIAQVASDLNLAADLIARLGNDRKSEGAQAAHEIHNRLERIGSLGDVAADERTVIRDRLNRVLTELKAVEDNGATPEADKKTAEALHGRLGRTVQYAPWWVRIVSALCLGLGTMIGYKRIVRTLGERLGKQHLVPAQGAAAELVAAGLIGGAGITGFPVSTTHVVTGGIAGTMVGSGAGVQPATLWQIATAWVLTLPATIVLSGTMFYLMS